MSPDSSVVELLPCPLKQVVVLAVPTHGGQIAVSVVGGFAVRLFIQVMLELGRRLGGQTQCSEPVDLTAEDRPGATGTSSWVTSSTRSHRTIAVDGAHAATLIVARSGAMWKSP